MATERRSATIPPPPSTARVSTAVPDRPSLDGLEERWAARWASAVRRRKTDASVALRTPVAHLRILAPSVTVSAIQAVRDDLVTATRAAVLDLTHGSELTIEVVLARTPSRPRAVGLTLAATADAGEREPSHHQMSSITHRTVSSHFSQFGGQ